MNDQRKPSDDLKDGLDLLFRAARGAIKQVDLSKIDKGLHQAIDQANRVVGTVGRTVGDEIDRIAKSGPPWSHRGETPCQCQKEPCQAEAAPDASAPNSPAPAPEPGGEAAPAGQQTTEKKQ